MTQFTPENESKIAALFERYPKKEAALLPVLWIAQEQFGALSAEVRRLVAQTVEVSLAHVEGVIGFYTMYTKEPRGKFHLQLCRNLSCALAGYGELRAVLEEETGLKPGQSSGDGLFTYSLVECLGACGQAPVMQVNLDPYCENLNADSLRSLLRSMRQKHA